MTHLLFLCRALLSAGIGLEQLQHLERGFSVGFLNACTKFSRCCFSLLTTAADTPHLSFSTKPDRPFASRLSHGPRQLEGHVQSQSHHNSLASSTAHTMARSNGTGVVIGLRRHSEARMDHEVKDSDSEEGGRGVISRATPGTATAPDGGWGWVVLVSSILVLALTLGFPSCVGIFYMDLQNEFKASNSEISWVPSIMTSVLHAGGKDVLC